MNIHSKWHGKKYYFGLHYDLHAQKTDTVLGTRCSRGELVPMLKKMRPDFVQTDCKGHAGYTSWFSKTKDASVPPKMKKDALKQWRAATKELGMPLHCHYSGIWDKALGAKHPDWCIQPYRQPDAKEAGQSFAGNPKEKLCPRSPYLDKYMIPQMKELIDRYNVDGFWIDGDLWAVEPCYCERCRKAWTEQTGHAEPPHDETHDLWPAWWHFTLESFNEYVTKYTDAVHAHKAGVLVCSNWLQTFANPGEPKVPTDWISGDNVWANGVDGSRCEARFLSTRQKHWDIMLWNFTRVGSMSDETHPWFAKPVEMLKQEAAILLSFGGAVQLYENPATSGAALRSGQLIPWRQNRMSDVGRFVKARRSLCQDSETIPQIAVLHSEHHLHTTTRGKNMMWSVDLDPVRGAVFALLEKHYGVDVLDEWALLQRLDEFPVVVVPEREGLSEEMVAALKSYVDGGGHLLVSGSESFTTFGGKFLGVAKGKQKEKAIYHIGSGKEAAPFYSEAWRLCKPTSAKIMSSLCETDILEEYQTRFPAATMNKVGKGRVVYLPGGLFRAYQRDRNPLQREVLGEIVAKLAPPFGVVVDAPSCVDVALRRKKERRIIHFVNRGTGLPNAAGSVAVDEIAPVGPITVRIKRKAKPASVTLAFEDASVKTVFSKGLLTVTIDTVHIHSALVIE
jgi:hypothetical protein